MGSMPDCAILVRSGREIVAVNDQAKHLFGYTSEQLIGQPIETFVPHRFSQTHPRQVDGFFRDPRPIAIGVRKDLYGRHKDGREIPVEIGLTPIELDDVMLVLAMVRDISARVHAAEKNKIAH